jgi:hypothetical protein
MRKKSSFKSYLVVFFLGMIVMFLLDMYFHFNNSIETEIDKGLNKAQKKIEELLK